MKIVVANSVGVDQDGFHMVHVPSRWSLGVRNFTNCGYYPWQLAYTSSLLKRDTPHDVTFLDGVLNGWDFKTYFEKLEKIQPDWLIMESSSRTWLEDSRLAQAAKEAFGTRLIFTGQHPMAEPEGVLKVADHVLIGEYEFIARDLILGKNPSELPGVYPNERGPLIDVDALPFPEDEDIRRMDYHEPNCIYRQIQMYASRGCPRRCNFCAAATLYYDELNWRPRNVKSIVTEIGLLKDKYPEMEGVFFDEEVHNIKKSFNIELAQAIRAEGLTHLKYEAMCEYASLDEEAMTEMAKAGYYKIRVGIETGSDVVAGHMTLGKKHDIGKLKRMLEIGKELGLLFYGTISMGGLGSNKYEDQKTVDLVHELSAKGWLDEVQVSVNTPQPGTDFFHSAEKNGWLKPVESWNDFDGNGHVVVDYPDYPADSIQNMFQAALTAFDRGKEESTSDGLLSLLEGSLEEIPEGSKVLVLRSVRPWMITLLCAALHRYRNLRPDVLAQDAMLEVLKSNEHVNEVYSYGSGFFNREQLPDSLLESLRGKNYDWILVPMANNHQDGYQNVLEVADHLGGENILGVYNAGHARTLAVDSKS